jgi:ABC-type branched-subunit amino acid transport system ATPase component
MSVTADPLDRPVDVRPDPDVAALQVNDLAIRFGGVKAVDGVTLTVEREQIVGLIGTNGAGKTTLMDCISGYAQPDAGQVLLYGCDVTRLAPELRPYVGLGRSFQDARLYPSLTVQEILLVAVERHAPSGFFASLLRLDAREERAKRVAVERLMKMTGLTDYAERRASQLSTGTRRIVDLTCILAQRPQLLCLDEPTAGVAQRETEVFGPLLRRIQDELGCSILLIEHDMPLILSLSDVVYAMESGRVIASGDPDTVKNDPRVVASYLGTTEEAINRSNHASGVSSPTSANASVRPDQPDLHSMTTTALRQVAASRQLQGRSRMTRDQLIEELGR